MSIHESSPGDRGAYFDIARAARCEICGKVIPESADAMYEVDTGLLVGRCCGPR